MICREFHFLFVHVPKAAGQSIEQFFLDRLGADWNADRERFLLQANEDTSRGTEKLAHLSAAEYVDDGYLAREEFDRLFKFSFVRNPWTRILSEYRYRNYFSHRSFRDFVLHKLPRPGWDDQYRHVMPQYDMLHDTDGRLLVDFVGRFESLHDDFRTVCGKLGIENAELPHRNPSDKKSRDTKRKVRNWLYFNGENRINRLADFYDDETRDAVADYYRKDIQAFGYEFPW